jgi:hypothetical protein
MARISSGIRSVTTRRSLLVFPLAATLWLASVPFARGHVDADPNKEYAVTPVDGVWMICAASYTGEPSLQLAHKLVVEIRQRFDLPAFVFNRGDVERRQQQEEFDRQAEQRRKFLREMGADPTTPITHRVVHIEDQCAVLVGGYRDIETARKELDRIRRLDPPRTVPTDKMNQFDDKGNKVEEVPVNPFVHSFVVRNPTVPREAADNTPDPFLKTLNANESYSLLKCPRPWTLMVKQYTAPVQFEPVNTAAAPSFWQKFKKMFNDDGGKQLNAAAVNAHNLAEVLHKMGFEAYVLHTRHTSVVAVGGFDSKEDPRMDSVKTALVRGLGVDFTAPQGAAVDRGRLMAQLQLMSPPLPIPVPRP